MSLFTFMKKGPLKMNAVTNPFSLCSFIKVAKIKRKDSFKVLEKNGQ